MSNNKQSSVEWLINQYSKYFDDSNIPFKVIEQAKEMHKREIQSAFYSGRYEYNNYEDSSEQYYNEEYGK